MKKIFFIVLATLAFSYQSALAQNMFNHLSLGASVGLDGLGIEAATPLGDHFQLRAGYSFVPFSYSQNIDLGTVKLGTRSRDMNNTPVSASLWEGGNGNLLVDWFPSDGPFHLTAGLFAGSGNFLTVDVDMRSALDPEEYGTLGIGFENGPTLTTDPEGFANVDCKVLNVMPYAGIGIGRAISDNRITVSFDLGALVTGGIKPQAYNYMRNLLDPSNPVEVIPITSDALNNKDDGWVDKISGIGVFPLLKLSVFVNLF